MQTFNCTPTLRFINEKVYRWKPFAIIAQSTDIDIANSNVMTNYYWSVSEARFDSNQPRRKASRRFNVLTKDTDVAKRMCDKDHKQVHFRLFGPVSAEVKTTATTTDNCASLPILHACPRPTTFVKFPKRKAQRRFNVLTGPKTVENRRGTDKGGKRVWFPLEPVSKVLWPRTPQ